MSLQFQPSQNSILNSFQRAGLNSEQYYLKEQIFSALDKLSGQIYDKDVAQQLFEQCQTNQRGQVKLDDFAQVIIEADKVLKKKIQQTEQQIQQFQDELRDCQQQAQEQQYTQQLNPQGVDRDSQLCIIIKQANNIQTQQDFANSFVTISVDDQEQHTSLSQGDKMNPTFNHQINFPIQTGSEEIILRLYTTDRNQKKNLIGQSHIDLGVMHDQQVHSQQLQLVNQLSQQIMTTISIESQWIHNKLKYHQEMVQKYQQTILQYQDDVADYYKDLLIVQQPFLENSLRNNLQQSLRQPQIAPVNQALLFQQQQQNNQSYQKDKFIVKQDIKIQQNIPIQSQFGNNQLIESNELSDELYYGFILYLLMIILALFQCFARPDYLDIILGMFYLLIVIRDCFEENYIKIVGGITVLTVINDIVWISFYKNWWSGTDKTLPTWGEAGDPIVRMTLVFCIFNIILKTALCYILFHYFKASKEQKSLKFEFWQFSFPVGILKQNLFTINGLLA